MTKKPTKKPIKKPAKKKLAVKTAAPKPKPVDPYHSEFDGTYTMKDYDNEANALKRWFDNFKIERYVNFASEYECLIVEEVPASAKHIKKRQICRIENAGEGTVREVKMDHTAPPAPIVFFAAKQRYVPPPPKTPKQLQEEEHARIMYARGFVPHITRVPIRRMSLPSLLDFNPDDPILPTMTMHFEEQIEWVKKEPFDYNFKYETSPPPAPAAPRYRRN